MSLSLFSSSVSMTVPPGGNVRFALKLIKVYGGVFTGEIILADVFLCSVLNLLEVLHFLCQMLGNPYYREGQMQAPGSLLFS